MAAEARRTRRRAFPIAVAVLVVILIVAVVVAAQLLRTPDFVPISIPTVSSV